MNPISLSLYVSPSLDSMNTPDELTEHITIINSKRNKTHPMP